MKFMSKRFKTLFFNAGLVLLFSLVAISQVEAQTCVAPPDGLVSWWPGDGNADDIQNGNDGTLQNGATFAQGLVGQAFSLDGIDDFVNVGNAPTLHVSAGNFTVEAWVKFNVEGVFPDIDDMSIADKISPEGINQNGWRLMRQRDNGHFWFCFGGGTINGCDFNDDRTGMNATSVRSTTVAQKNVWYHVVGILSSDQIAIYVNGIREGEKARPLFTDTHATDLLIGANAPEGAHLNGLVDEVAIYNRALSAAEIQAIFNAGRAGKCKEPDNDGDGVPNDEDECPNSDLSATVIIDGCNSGVPNTLFPSGCTISDLIAECAEGAHNRGRFVSCVSDLTDDLKEAGTIMGQQKGAIQSCAARANVP
jgi:hypothetical protein